MEGSSRFKACSKPCCQQPKHPNLITSTKTVYVVHGLQVPLLGQPAIAALHLFSQIDAILSNKLSKAQIYTHFLPLLKFGQIQGTGTSNSCQSQHYSILVPRTGSCLATLDGVGVIIAQTSKSFRFLGRQKAMNGGCRKASRSRSEA